MRLSRPLSALCLLAPALALCAWADDPAPAPPPADKAPAEAGAVADPPPEGDGSAAGGEEAGPAPSTPEGVKRLPPGTAAEEREYKKRKTREDPFLTSPPVKAGKAFYDPAASLRPDLAPGLSRFLVQDLSGKVLGYLSLELRREKHPVEGELLHCTEATDFAPQYKLEVWAFADTYRPRRARLSQPDKSLATDSAPVEITADYLFDRQTVTEITGEVSTRSQRRLPPFTFDSAELLLLLRELQFVRGDWPFEAGLIDFASGDLLPLSVAAPKIVECTAADGLSYGCYELAVTHGREQLRAWVERASPHRLVKLQRGSQRLTLIDYQAY